MVSTQACHVCRGVQVPRSWQYGRIDKSGREIIEINRFYPSSKLCNCCGYKNSNLTLKDRSWKCPVCNTVHDRDYNAAINIKKEGERILSIKENKLNNNVLIGLGSPEYTLEDCPLMDDKAVMPLKSYDRMIQEKNELCKNVI